MSRARCRQIRSHHIGDAAYPIDHKGNESTLQSREVDFPRQQSRPASGGSWATHSCPASTTSLNTAALAASFARHACPPESPPQYAATQKVEPVEEGATGELHNTSTARCFDQQVVHRREQDHIEGGPFKGSRRDDHSLSRAERRAEEAEAAERLAKHEARVAKGEVERLRREGAELSAWRDAVLDIRDALEQAEKDGGGKSDTRDNVDAGEGFVCGTLADVCTQVPPSVLCSLSIVIIFISGDTVVRPSIYGLRMVGGANLGFEYTKLTELSRPTLVSTIKTTWI